MKTVDHSYEQALIMHDNVHILVIMNIIVTPKIWPKLGIYGHLAIGPCATNIGKWGIPEKSYQNLAQQC